MNQESIEEMAMAPSHLFERLERVFQQEAKSGTHELQSWSKRRLTSWRLTFPTLMSPHTAPDFGSPIRSGTKIPLKSLHRN